MFQIDKTIVSEEIISNDFVCNLSACKGACCIDGEAGAPLEESELSILESIYPSVKPYLRPEGLTAIEAQGVYIKGVDGDWETPLIDGADCAYVIFDNKGVALCAIEKAYNEGKNRLEKTYFLPPLSSQGKTILRFLRSKLSPLVYL